MKRNNTAAENAVKAPCTLDQETCELLTLAAKAVGITIREWVGGQANVTMPDGKHCGWNPLASWGGGEAMALTVKLRLALIPLEGGGWDVEHHDGRGNSRTLASCANGGKWALQEAIVQAAARLAANAGGRAAAVAGSITSVEEDGDTMRINSTLPAGVQEVPHG